MMVHCPFPWKKPNQADVYVSSVKWQQNTAKYEIYSATLEDMDIETLLPHCMEVKGKVRKEVSNDSHLGPSYFKVFP